MYLYCSVLPAPLLPCPFVGEQDQVNDTENSSRGNAFAFDLSSSMYCNAMSTVIDHRLYAWLCSLKTVHRNSWPNQWMMLSLSPRPLCGLSVPFHVQSADPETSVEFVLQPASLWSKPTQRVARLLHLHYLRVPPPPPPPPAVRQPCGVPVMCVSPTWSLNQWANFHCLVLQ